ncbi:MAG: PaaI family thioesterase [Candidatus Omnitrophica bacterium]|nr:PaaI family thioesterase [Candidatus Omnitrophota bacterium]
MSENFAFNDQFAPHLGMEYLDVKDGYSKVKLKVQDHFLNGAGTVHGGVIFSLADYAFALAANTSGEMGLAIHGDINFIKPGMPGDELIAEVKLDSRSRRLGNYSGTISNQNKEPLAYFHAIAYFKKPKK